MQTNAIAYYATLLEIKLVLKICRSESLKYETWIFILLFISYCSANVLLNFNIGTFNVRSNYFTNKTKTKLIYIEVDILIEILWNFD